VSYQVTLIDTVSSDAYTQIAFSVGAAAAAATAAAYWKASTVQVALSAFIAGAVVGALFVRRQLQDAEDDKADNTPDPGETP
jgi:hypothetical protein